ncbi:hypothetical protein [uncultured Methanoregula sp.]|uniref:hypothetical protein n=1 Tax=uncultured Methanoregula sp. TaxID=1005933 RepID=UPI002AAAB835|nr:hypothetical protein [uncultured Methanoregula sp.]
MKKTFLYIAVALIVVVLFSAGCTSPSAPAPAPAPAPTTPVVAPTEIPTTIATTVPQPAKTTSSLVPTTTDVVPENQAVSISIEKAGTYSTTIITAFNGGKGLMSVSRMDVKVTHPDGSVVTGSVDKPGMGATVELEGTKGNDRAEVTLTMRSGSVYKVMDQLVPYKTRS